MKDDTTLKQRVKTTSDLLYVPLVETDTKDTVRMVRESEENTARCVRLHTVLCTILEYVQRNQLKQNVDVCGVLERIAALCSHGLNATRLPHWMRERQKEAIRKMEENR